MASTDSVDHDELYAHVFTPHEALVPLHRTATPQLAFHDESHYKKVGRSQSAARSYERPGRFGHHF